MPKGAKYGGRSKGTPNKVTQTVRERFQTAFELLQSHETSNLRTWAENNPTEFYRLASKLIPLQVGTDPDNPIKPTTIIQLIPDPGCKPIE